MTGAVSSGSLCVTGVAAMTQDYSNIAISVRQGRVGLDKGFP